jgi:hypothetical protein
MQEEEGVVASLLSRDILICIYSHLKDPVDMWSFMRANKLFHRAGCLYTGYANKIEKLRVVCGLALPFYFINDVRKRFFALCFVSCQKDLEARIIRCIEANGGGMLLSYCLRICGISAGAEANFLDGVFVRRFETYGAYSKHYILHSSDKNKSQFSKIKESIKKIIES